MRRRRTLKLTALAVTLLAAWLGPAAAAFASPPVTVFPSPGTQYNTPREQIAFRGISPSAIGAFTVTGSVTGLHTGHIEADSDGRGGSFLPDKPFAQGETVKVATSLNVVGATNGTFSFGIAHSTGLIPYGKLPVVPAGADGVQHFRSRPDLQPPSVQVTKDSAPASDGDIFLSPQFGPAQDGPMILDPKGNLVWFQPYPVSENTLIANFEVQNLYGQPVLTWWQGNTNGDDGRGVDVIYDRNYQQLATVRAANGLDAGLHEFLLTPDGDAYLTATWPVRLPGVAKPALDSVVQEIDVWTGLVLFEWHALDHVPRSTSYNTPTSKGALYDPYHVNSISFDRSGNLILSMRATNAVYDVSPETGGVLWTLGGKSSSFKMGKGTSTWGQHDAVMQADGTITLFDDGAGPPEVHPQSRGVRESLDMKRRTATLIKEYDHSPSLSANFEGSLQTLPGGDVFLGWGQQPYFSEDRANGQQDFDAHFVSATSSYRAFRFPWSAQPPTLPTLAVSPDPNGSTSLYASWNGATDVSSWRVLGGASPGTLSVLGAGAKRGFETDVAVPSQDAYLAVQALGSNGKVLSTSSPAASSPSIAIDGGSSFVSSSGFGGLPVSCFAPHPCQISTTITSGATVIARAGSEHVAAGGAGIVYYQLTAHGRALLQSAKGNPLAVRVAVRDRSGLAAGVAIKLIAFDATGPGPSRSVSNAPTLQIAGTTDFVTSDGSGGILARCVSASTCRVRTEISAGSTVIARTAPEFLGANELGYLSFTLTAAGRELVSHSSGNQLGVQVTLSDARATATGKVALVRTG